MTRRWDMVKGTSKGLTKAQLKRFRTVLEAKASEIRKGLRSLSDHRAMAHGDDPRDLEDMPGQSHEEWIFLNRNSIDTLLLREIRAAIDSIENSTYGTCLECYRPISTKRLEAVPWARYCVPCQEDLSSSQESRPREKRFSGSGN